MALFLPLVTIEVKADNSNQALYEMARHYELSGRKDKALGIYRLIVNRNPNELEAQKRLETLGTTKPIVAVQIPNKRILEQSTHVATQAVKKTKVKATSNKHSAQRSYALQLATMDTNETSKAEELALKYSDQLGVKCTLQRSAIEREDGSRNLYIRCSPSVKRSEVEKLQKNATAKGLDSMVITIVPPRVVENISVASKPRSNLSIKATIGEGYKRYNKGKFQEAKQIFQKVLQQNPSDSDAHEGLGYIYLQQKEYDQCAFNLQKRYDANPDLKTAQNLLECYSKGESPKLADEFYASLPLEKKALLRNPIVEAILQEIDVHISRGELIFAVEKLDRLYKNSPNNSEVLLRYANLYMAKKEYAAAKEYYETVLDKEPVNPYAQKGLAGAFMALGDYKRAIKVYEKLPKNTDTRQLYKAKMEYAFKEKRYSDAAGYAEAYLKLDHNDIDVYLKLSTIYENLKEDNKATHMLDEASRIDKDAFNVKLARLYFMLTHEYYRQIVRTLDTFEKINLSLEDSKKLKVFYQAYYQKLSGEMLQRKEYTDALLAAKSGLMMIPWDSILLNTAGWSAFNLKEYQVAETYFANMCDIDSKNYEAFYSLGITFSALKRRNDAEKAFIYAEETADQTLLEKLLDAYKQISYKEGVVRLTHRLSKLNQLAHKVSSSKEITPLDSVGSPINRDLMNMYNPFIEEIFEENSTVPMLRRNPTSVKERSLSVPKFDGYSLQNKVVPQELLGMQTSSSISSGIFIKTRSGNKGLDGLIQTSVPLDIDLKWEDGHTLYADLNWVTLNSGAVNPTDYARFGSGGSVVVGNSSSDTQGLIPSIGYEHIGSAIDFDAHIGSTLQGGNITPVLTWGAEIRVHPEEKIEGYLKNEKVSVTDSLLSYAGANDPFVAGSQWGRVTKEGMKAGVKYQDSWTWALDLAYYYAIGGKNVIDNTQSSVTAMVAKDLQLDDFYYFNLGPIVVMDRYAHNSNYFTFGHGGYFSPQNFLLVGIYTDVAKIVNDNLFFRAKGNVGYLSFSEDASPKYPLSNAPATYYPPNSVHTIGYDIKFFGGYRLDKQWDILFGMGMQQSKDFDSTFIGASAVYYFGKQGPISPESLRRTSTLEKGLQ